MTIVAAMALLSGCVCDRCGGNAESREDGFVRIFNGRDLEGWMGRKDLFYVENGDLVFREGKSNYGNLFYHRELKDFVARFDFKLVPNGNNGFAVRAGRPCVDGGALIGGNKVLADAAYNGMEIQVLDDTGPLKQHLKAWQYHGSIYGVVAAQKGALKPVGEWNHEEVTVVGENVTVVLNDRREGSAGRWHDTGRQAASGAPQSRRLHRFPRAHDARPLPQHRNQGALR